MKSHWRGIAAPIIAKCIADHGHDKAELKKALRDAYPFGERNYHPYKIWLDEIKKQCGSGKRKQSVPTNQLTLF